MTRRTTALILGMAALAGGCTVTPHHHEVRAYPDERRVIHEDDAYERRVIYEDDAYEGYYYVRIVYLGGVPWYVDEDLRARPVPPHLRSHFRYGTWSRSAPPSFGRDDGMRDGYRLSRIVYIDGVPHHVDEGRHARPIPARLRSRFAYESVARHDDGRRPGERAAPPFARGGNEARPLPPGYGGRERRYPPVHEADNAPGRGMPPGQMREQARPLPPAAAREREESSTFGRGSALGRVTERVRAEARPLPPATARERQPQPDFETDSGPRRGMPQPPMRADAGRQAPYADRGRAQQEERRSAEREQGRDERLQQGSAQREQSAGDGRQRGVAAVDERKGEAAPGRKNGKGKGRDDEETDSPDARDGDAGRRNRRDE